MMPGTCELLEILENDIKLEKENAEDAKRFAYLYSGRKTECNDLIEIELRMLNNDIPSLDEVRKAIDECIKMTINK